MIKNKTKKKKSPSPGLDLVLSVHQIETLEYVSCTDTIVSSYLDNVVASFWVEKIN